MSENINDIIAEEEPQKMIYLDYASTSYVANDVLDAVIAVLTNVWGNPSNNYSIGQDSKELIEESRNRIATALSCSPDEIFFTSGSSEGNAWALAQRNCCFCSPYEHHNITENKKTVIIPDNKFKKIIKDYDPVKNAKDYLTVCYSHQLVNNETGEIFNVAPLFAGAKRMGMFTHCDMTQALGNMKIDFGNPDFQDIDMATFSGHKFGAPKGIGFVYIKNGIPVFPLIYGGIQESGIRAGTENIPYIYGLGIAVEKAVADTDGKIIHSTILRDVAIAALEESGVDYILNHGKNNIPSTLNFCLKDIEGEVVQAYLSDQNIFIGTGSACNTGTFEPSAVLLAMGVPEDYIRGEIRLSFGMLTTPAEVEDTINMITEFYNGIFSPEYEAEEDGEEEIEDDDEKG